MISLTTGLHHVVFKGRNVVWYFDMEDVSITEHKSVNVIGGNSQPLAAAKVVQHSTAMYSLLFINWLQLAAEYGSCSLQILTSPNQ